MDGQAALHDSSHIVMDVIRTKLNQSSRELSPTYLARAGLYWSNMFPECQRMYDHAGEAIDKAWTDNRGL